MGHRLRSEGNLGPSDVNAAVQSVISISSSGDEAANEDLSIAIVEKARQRVAKRGRPPDYLDHGVARTPLPVADKPLGSPSFGVTEVVSDPGHPASSSAEELTPPVDQESKHKQKKTRKKRKKKKNQHGQESQQEYVEEKEAADIIGDEEEPQIKSEPSIISEVTDAPDNLVFRKLLRGIRYFDPEEEKWEACFNCGENGHIAADCTMGKRQKPCFVCGLFDHNSKQCFQGQDCFVCKRKGHLARDCPDKNKCTILDSELCLLCGERGHVMSYCRNDYSPDDMEVDNASEPVYLYDLVQCYVCKKFGHLCCVNFTDTGPREVSCYKCAHSGHTGVGCAKPRGESLVDLSPSTCYVCHEEGHFARSCTKKTKSSRKLEQPSTPRTFKMAKRGSRMCKSAPRDFEKDQKHKTNSYEGKWNMTAGRSKIRGGWVVDDPGGLPAKKFRDNDYASPRIPTKKSKSYYSSNFSGHSASSQSSKKRNYAGTPGSYIPAMSYHL